jgi:hypothetical protein
MVAGINPTDQRAIVLVCSELKHKSLSAQNALPHTAMKPMLTLGLTPPGIVLAKYVVQHSFMLKQRETIDTTGLLRG